MHYQWLTLRFCQAGDKELALRIYMAVESRIHLLLLTLFVTLRGYY
jgi:hypothetical protein